MHGKLIAAAAMAILLATPGSYAAEARPAVSPAKAPKEEIVCRSEQTLGSHLPKRVCTTRAAREAQAKADQERMRNMHEPVRPNSTSNR